MEKATKHLPDNARLKAAAERGKNLASSSRLTDEYTDDETEFLRAIDHYKTTFNRPIPTVCEIFEVFRSLGYTRA